MASSKGKRKRSVVTLEVKHKIIKEPEEDKSQRLVAEQFKVAKSMISDIWRDREKIKKHMSSCANPQQCAKCCFLVREPVFSELDKACYLWFLQQCAKGAPVAGPVIQEKALHLFSALYPKNTQAGVFKASTGWLHRFCVRHGIRALSLQGELLSADVTAVEPFRSTIKELMEKEGYSKDQVFNADETGLWWRLMPSVSLVACGEKQAKNFKQSKDRVTLLACANASGACKLPLAFINKYKKPRCFNHMYMATLPVHYYKQANAGMDANVFENWFHNKFVPSVKKYCNDNNVDYKVLLLIDNAPAHPSEEVLKSRDGK